MTTNEFKPDWDEKLALTEEVIRLSKRIEELEAQPEPWEKFCDSNCVWTDHHPDCKLAQPAVTKSHKQEPVACGYDETTGNCTNNPCCYTTPPQRPSRSDIKPLTDEEIEDIWADCPADWDDKINVLTLARAIEAAVWEKQK